MIVTDGNGGTYDVVGATGVGAVHRYTAEGQQIAEPHSPPSGPDKIGPSKRPVPKVLATWITGAIAGLIVSNAKARGLDIPSDVAIALVAGAMSAAGWLKS